MKTILLPALSALAAGVTLCVPLHAQTSATTDPVGYAKISCLANSDTRISIPFTRPAEFTGTIQSISSPAQSATATITVAATPNWTANQFAYASGTQPKTYYAIIGSNLASMTGTVNATNASKSVTGTGTAFLSQIGAGDAILINGSQATVASVASDTALTLVSPFIGTTATGTAAKSDRSPREGVYFTVTANGSNTLTVDLNGDSLASIAGSLGNTSVSLIPYWTLGTAFPTGDAGVSYIASTSSLILGRRTQILLPDLVSVGTNLPPNLAYYFYNNAWRRTDQNAGLSFDDTVLVPSSYFIVRNVASATTFTPVGSVYMNRVSIALDTQTSGGQDNAVAINRPSGVSLNDLGILESNAFTPSTSSLILGRKDVLLTYDDTQSGINKAPTGSYYYFNNGWRSATGSAGTDVGSTVLPYGTGFIIRKVATTNGSTNFWKNTRNY